MDHGDEVHIDRTALQSCKLVDLLVTATTARNPTLGDRLQKAAVAADWKIDALVRVLSVALGDPAPTVRNTAAWAFGLLGEFAPRYGQDKREIAGDALTELIQAIADADVGVRLAVIGSLGKFVDIAGEQIVASAYPATRDLDARVRHATIDLIRSVGPYASVPVVRALIRVIAGKDQPAELVGQAIDGLRDAGRDAASEAVPALMNTLANQSIAAEIRIRTCSLLSWLGADARPAAAGLIKVLLAGNGSSDEGVCVEVARALVNVGGILLLQDRVHPDHREEILGVLRGVGAEAAEARRSLQAAWEIEAKPELATTPKTPEEKADELSPAPSPDRLAMLEDGIDEIQKLLKAQDICNKKKEWYTVKETAERAGYAEWTIRHACLKRRIKAEKGQDGNWRISHEELVQLQSHGLAKEPDVE